MVLLSAKYDFDTRFTTIFIGTNNKMVKSRHHIEKKCETYEQ